jgi:hypothetical protein
LRGGLDVVLTLFFVCRGGGWWLVVGNTQTQFQAYCTWQMWNAMVNNPNGEQKWVQWFSRLFSESEHIFGPKRKKKALPRSLLLEYAVLRVRLSLWACAVCVVCACAWPSRGGRGRSSLR